MWQQVCRYALQDCNLPTRTASLLAAPVMIAYRRFPFFFACFSFHPPDSLARMRLILFVLLGALPFLVEAT